MRPCCRCLPEVSRLGSTVCQVRPGLTMPKLYDVTSVKDKRVIQKAGQQLNHQSWDSEFDVTPVVTVQWEPVDSFFEYLINLLAHKTSKTIRKTNHKLPGPGLICYFV